MNLVRFAIAAALAWAVSISLMGCSGAPDQLHGDGTSDDENTGTITARLTVGNVTVGKLDYQFSNGRHTYAGKFNFEYPMATMIEEVQGGSGYSLVIDGPTDDGLWWCQGEANDVTVIGGRTTNLDIVIRCEKARGHGKLGINGTLVLCPSIEDLWAEQPYLCAVPLHLSVTDEGKAAGLSYLWTGFPGLEGTDPVIKCTATETIDLTVFLTSTDPPCSDVSRLTVKCPCVL